MQGIYYIKNKTNGKIYIGSSKNIEKRIKQHKNDLINNKHKSQWLQFDYNKYGSEYFEYEVLEEVMDNKDLLKREKYYIEKYETIDKGYNTNTALKDSKQDQLKLLKEKYKLIEFKNVEVHIQNRDNWKHDVYRLNREINLYTVLPVVIDIIEYYWFPKMKNKIIQNKIIIDVKIESFYKDSGIYFSIKHNLKNDNWNYRLLFTLGDVLKYCKENNMPLDKGIKKMIDSRKYLMNW